MKAVAMTADEVARALQVRLMGLGLMKGLGTKKRQSRVAHKLFALSLGVLARRLKEARRRATLVRTLGTLASMAKAKVLARRASKVGAVGLLCRLIKHRDAARRRALLWTAGLFTTLLRARDMRRRCVVAFAFGLPTLALRLKGGEPKGYVYGIKGKKPPAPKGPRVRGIHWDTLTESKGTIWSRRGEAKNPMLLLRELFPDLKQLFTEKERVKKGGAGGEEGGEEGAEKKPPKPKEITFLDSTVSRNCSIALTKFKNLPGFKDGDPPARFAVVRAALEDMDESRMLGNEGVENLEKNLWWKKEGATVALLSAETMEAIKGVAPEQLHLLAFAENFAYEMSRVPLLESRVKCILVKASLEENVALVTRDLVVFQNAAKEVLYNPLLVEFLVDVVRPFGNELNRAGGKKDALGIKISGLVKLGATKTADNSMTSLYYIVSVLHHRKPKLLTLCSAFTAGKEVSGEHAFRSRIPPH